MAACSFLFPLRSERHETLTSPHASCSSSKGFSRRVPRGERISASRPSKGERGLWQRRYWEHLIREDADFERHVDYIHFNPVKHGWVQRAADWPHSSIHRFIREGVIDVSCASVGDVEIDAGE